MSDVHTLTFEGIIPPSFNRVGGTSSWRVWQNHKKAWEARMTAALLNQGVPQDTGMFARTTAILTVPTRRRRDAGNFGVVLEKALGDALQAAGVIPDDTPEHWSWTSVSFRHVPRQQSTTVLIALVDPMAVHIDPLGMAA